MPSLETFTGVVSPFTSTTYRLWFIAYTYAVLSGEKGPHRDIVALNAAAGLIAAGVVDGIGDGYDAAQAAIDSGAASAVLAKAVAVSQAAKADEGA